MSKPLNPKQEAFCREYVIDLNATQAATRAGYSAKTARAIGARLLTKVDVQVCIQQLMDERSKRTGITADRVLIEIEHLAMFDPKDLTKVRKPDDIAELPEEVRRAIVGWGWDKSGNFTVKMAKEKALEMLGRHHKLFTDKVEVEVVDSLAERLERVRAKRAAK